MSETPDNGVAMIQLGIMMERHAQEQVKAERKKLAALFDTRAEKHKEIASKAQQSDGEVFKLHQIMEGVYRVLSQELRGTEI